MRKNKLLISTLLPVAAFVTVVGAGYSAWYFQGNSTADATASITVTPVTVGGGISVTSKEHGLTLDQQDTTNNPSAAGITWKSITVKYTADKSDVAATGTGQITWTVQLPDSFGTYVSTTKTTGTWNITSLNSDQEFTLAANDITFAYVDEPSNYTEWKAMSDAFKGQNINVTFNATYSYDDPSVGA